MMDGAKSGARNWTLFMLFVVSVLNLFDRHVINILAQDIKADLEISDTELGLLTGAAFGLFYSILAIPLGRLADRVDRIRLIAAALSIWSVFTILSGFASNFLQLFLARLGVGIGEAGSQPASATLVPDVFPKKFHGIAISILMLGAPVGSFLGMVLGGLAGAEWGWRTAFLLAGLPGLLVAVILLVTLNDPRKKEGTPPRPPRLGATLHMLWDNRPLRYLAAYLSCATFMIYASGAWLPAFFIRIFDLTTAQTGAYTGLALGVGGSVGVMSGGFVSDLLRNRWAQIEYKVLAVTTLLAVPCLTVTLFTGQLSLSIVTMSLFYIFAFAYLSPAITLIQRQTSSDTRAFTVALCISIANIFSLAIGVPAVGLLSDILAPVLGHASIAVALSLGLCTVAAGGLYCLWMSHRYLSPPEPVLTAPVDA